MDSKSRIIALIDLTKDAENLVRFAEKFAAFTASSIVFVHKVIGFIPAMADTESRKTLLNQEKQEAKKYLKEITCCSEDLETTCFVSENSIIKILQDLRDPSFFDWVLVGLKDVKNLKRLLLGTTTVNILDKSNLLTIAIPGREEIPLPENLVVAVHPRFSLNHYQLEVVLQNFSAHAKNIELLTVVGKKDNEHLVMQYLKALQKKINGIKATSNILKGDNFVAEIEEYLKVKANTLLVVQKGPRNLKDNLLRKFTINELVYHGRTPLLILSE